MNKDEYHKRIRSLGCFTCGNPHAVVHHFAGGTAARRGRQGLILVIPLCPLCHAEVHRGKRTFWKKYGDPYAEAAKNYVRFLDGKHEKEQALRKLINK